MSTAGASDQEAPRSSSRLKIILAINTVVVVIGAAAIAVLLLSGDDDSKREAVDTTRRATTTDAQPDESDEPVSLADEDDSGGASDSASLQGSDTTKATAAATTAAPATLPPSTVPAPPPIPGPDDALGQARTTLTEFMAADTRGDIDQAMTYLAPPVAQWVTPANRNFTESQLRSNIGDRKSAAVALSVVDGPTLAFGPEPTPDGGWLIKVNYVMHAEGDYVSQDGSIRCVNNNQHFLDTLVAPSGGTPRITSHEQTGPSDNFC